MSSVSTEAPGYSSDQFAPWAQSQGWVEDSGTRAGWRPPTTAEQKARQPARTVQAAPSLAVVPEEAEYKDPLDPTKWVTATQLQVRLDQKARIEKAQRQGTAALGTAGTEPTAVGTGDGGPGGATMPSLAKAGATGGARMDHLRNTTDASRHALKVLMDDDDFKTGMEGQLKSTQDIVDQQLGILNSGIARQRQLTQESINETANFESKRKVLVDAQRHAAEGVQQQIDGITSEIMNYEIDANRAFKSTWQVVGAAIAAAAGAYAQGLSQGRVPNTALAIINKAVDRDIQAQKMELGRLQTAAGIKNNVYGRMLQMHGDELQALAETRAAAMSVVQLRLGSLRATTASKVQAASIALLQKRTEIQHANQTQQAKIKAQTNRLNSAVNEMRTMTSGTGGKKTMAQKIADVIPSIDRAITLWPKVSWKGAIAHVTGAGKLGLFRKDAIAAQAYNQTITLAIKRVVSIFEGSKPSDLDWRVMIVLLPEVWNDTEYGKGALQSFRDDMMSKAGIGTGFVTGDLGTWAESTRGAQFIQDALDVPQDKLDAFKEKYGIKE